MMRAVAYIRVSTEEQVDGHSLEAQERAINSFCEARRYKLVKTYREPGRSGKTAIRPQFQQMIADAESGQFDVIVVHKLDRFSRSLMDTLTYLGRLDKAKVSFVSATEDFDFTSAIGRVMLALLGAFAQWYLDNLSNEITKGKHERARKGYHNGRITFGYTTPKKLSIVLVDLGARLKAGTIPQHEYERQCAIIEDALDAAADAHETAAIIDPIAGDGVRLAFDMYSTGMSTHLHIAQALNDRGYRSNGKGNERKLFTTATISDIVRNRFYTGMIGYAQGLRGHERRSGNIEWIQGNHDALVASALFESCQVVRANRESRRGIKFGWKDREVHVYPLGGLIWCLDCGVSHRSKVVIGVRKYWHGNAAGACDKRPRYSDADHLEKIVENLFMDLILPKQWRNMVIERLSKTVAEPIADNSKQIGKQLERLKQLFVLGDLTMNEYKRESDKLKSQIITKTGAVIAHHNMDQVGSLLENFPAIWSAATPDERKMIATMLIKKIWLSEGIIKAIEPTPIMWVLLECALSGRKGANHDSAHTIALWVAPGTTAQQIISRAA